MSETRIGTDRKANLSTFLIVFGLAAGFLLWGIFLFYTVGVKWPPAWDYGAVPDVPGQSPYSTDSARLLPNVPPYFLHERAGLSPQHVKGRPSILESNRSPAQVALPQTPESQEKEPSP